MLAPPQNKDVSPLPLQKPANQQSHYADTLDINIRPCRIWILLGFVCVTHMYNYNVHIIFVNVANIL